jgi:hypothetical protein
MKILGKTSGFLGICYLTCKENGPNLYMTKPTCKEISTFLYISLPAFQLAFFTFHQSLFT